MLGQKTVCSLLGPPLWTCLVLGCSSAVEPTGLVVEVPEPGRGSQSPLPPDEGADEAMLPLRDIDAALPERESLLRATRTVADLRPRIERCFLAHVSGVQRRRVVVHFVLRGSGRVAGVSIEPDVGGATLRRCVRKVLNSAPFGRPSKDGLRVSVPLKLGVP